MIIGGGYIGLGLARANATERDGVGAPTTHLISVSGAERAEVTFRRGLPGQGEAAPEALPWAVVATDCTAVCSSQLRRSGQGPLAALAVRPPEFWSLRTFRSLFERTERRPERPGA